MQRLPLPTAAVTILAGCGPPGWPLDPAGAQASGITRLWWLFFAVCALAWVLTMAALAWAVARGRRREAAPPGESSERTQTRAVGGALAATVLLLVLLTGADFATTRSLTSIAGADDPLVIRVTGHQWWWDVTYRPDDPALRFRTANEIHLPVGRSVRLELESRDVIHSLWIPRLQGKRDLIPGYTGTLWIEAGEPGVYDGGCYEFCGMQHAKMRLRVVAVSPEEFDAWYLAQLAPSAPPPDALAARGREVFVSGPCALCHTVRGTPARGGVAPDLTHLGSRLTLAGGVLPNTRAYLGGWIVDPERIKPGTKMPPNPLPAEDLRALIHWLESLR